MDSLNLNQARQFILQQLFVLKPFFGRDEYQDFHTFFEKELKNSSSSSWEHLQLLVMDRGKIFELLISLSAWEKSQIPCQFDLYHCKSSGLCTRFVFHNTTNHLLEKFLDHLSCFCALYLKGVSQDLVGGLFLLSQPVTTKA